MSLCWCTWLSLHDSPPRARSVQVEHGTLNCSVSLWKGVPSRSPCASAAAILFSLAADCFSFFNLTFGGDLVGAILSLMVLTGWVADFYSAGGVICGGTCLLLADFLLSGFSIVSGYPISYVKVCQIKSCSLCNTRVFHQRHNRPGGHQHSITLERATLV